MSVIVKYKPALHILVKQYFPNPNDGKTVSLKIVTKITSFYFLYLLHF